MVVLAHLPKHYRYGLNENKKGVLLTPANKLASFKENKVERYWSPNVNFCNVTCSANRLFIHADTPQSLSSLSGSPVVYPQVTVYESNADTAPNGKTVYEFEVEENEIYPAAQGYRDEVILLDNSWRGGDMTSQVDYAGETTVRAVNVLHGIPQQRDVFSTKIGKRYSETGSCGPAYTANDVYSAFYYFDYPIRTGVKKLVLSKETQYSSENPSQSTYRETTYHYDNLLSNHQQLSRSITIDSDGDVLQTRYWYPADYTNTGEITPLLTKNVISIPIKQESYRNGQMISGVVTRLNSDGQPYEIYKYESATLQPASAHDGNVVVPPGYERKAEINYDPVTKNISRILPTDDVGTVYLWSYGNNQPIAKVRNATQTQVAATSFEYEGKGNWDYSGPLFNDITAKTGDYYYKLSSGSVGRTLDPGKYKLEYWAKGTVNVSGGIVTAIHTSSPDNNGWILYQKDVTISTTATLQLSGTATSFVDEVRVYPVGSQITTFTHDPLRGLTSSSDENNKVTYYEYDDVGRLKAIKDHEGNVLKQYEYHYQMEGEARDD